MTLPVNWICRRCTDRVCRCTIPAGVYPEQVLCCLTFYPVWVVEDMATNHSSATKEGDR